MFSEACERNKGPILARLERLFASSSRVLEIGSGTAQHAVHFAQHLAGLNWICSDLLENHAAIRARIREAGLRNLSGPLALDVRQSWPEVSMDAVFSANTAHIMAWTGVVNLFEHVAGRLPRGGRFVLYGPFHYGGVPSSSGNAAFDRELQARGTGAGIRDVEAVQALASGNHLRMIADCAMPANNRLLAWEKTG